MGSAKIPLIEASDMSIRPARRGNTTETTMNHFGLPSRDKPDTLAHRHTDTPAHRLLMSSKTAWAGAGSGEVLGWVLSLRLP